MISDCSFNFDEDLIIDDKVPSYIINLHIESCYSKKFNF